MRRRGPITSFTSTTSWHSKALQEVPKYLWEYWLIFLFRVYQWYPVNLWISFRIFFVSLSLLLITGLVLIVLGSALYKYNPIHLIKWITYRFPVWFCSVYSPLYTSRPLCHDPSNLLCSFDFGICPDSRLDCQYVGP